MDKQRKIFAGLLAVAAAAFAVDRMTGSAPPATEAATLTTGGRDPVRAASGVPVASAAASAPRGRSTTLPATRSLTVTETPTPTVRRSLAARLQDAARAERLKLDAVGDAFRPSRAWFPPPPPAARRDGNGAASARAGIPVPAAAPPRPDLAAIFRGRHRLTAVLRSGPAGTAAGAAASGSALIVDGSPAPGGSKERAARPGQIVNGFRLVALGKESAVFRSVAEPDVLVELAVERPRAFAPPASGVASTTPGE